MDVWFKRIVAQVFFILINTVVLMSTAGCNDAGKDASVVALQVTPVQTSIPKGLLTQYNATVIFSDNSTVDVTKSSSVHWIVDDPSVATVNSATGVVTSIDVGTTKITASALFDGVQFDETASLNVTEAVPQTLQITPTTSSLMVGVTKAFKAELLYSDNSVIDVTTQPALSWSSTDARVATIDSGIATAVLIGTTTIIASGQFDGVQFDETSSLTVVAKVAVPQRLDVKPAADSMGVGGTKAFSAELTFSDNRVVDVTKDPALSWLSNNTSVATIKNTTGVATAIGTGTTTITASGQFDGVQFNETASLVVTAMPAVPQTLRVTPTIDSLAVGLTKAFKAELIYSNNRVIDVTTDPNLSWSSTNIKIATIDSNSGIATSISIGSTTIIASGQFDGVQFDESASVNVTEAVPQTLKITPSNDSVAVGSTKAFKAELTYSDANVVDVTTEPALSWSSTETRVATINNTNGVSTGNAIGTATITASGVFNKAQFDETALLTVRSDRITVSNTNNYVTAKLSPSEFRAWNSVGINDGDHAKALTKEILSIFDDEFDFVLYIMNNKDKPSGMPFGEYSMVKNNIDGIGLNRFDHTSEFGSKGKLQGVLGLYGSMNTTGQLKALHLDASLHELFHRWGNWIVSQSYPGHWDQVEGVLTNSSFFAPIELYLMGLISDPYGADSSVWDPESQSVFDQWAAIADKFEPRMPSVGHAQSQFRGLIVLITEEEAPIDASMAIRLSDNIHNFQRFDGKHKVYNLSDGSKLHSRNFWNASRGLATIELDGLSDLR